MKTPRINENARPFEGIPGIQGKLYNLKRSKDEIYINDYNAAIIAAWGGNIDIQFISSDAVYVVDYVTTYASKTDRKSSSGMSKDS